MSDHKELKMKSDELRFHLASVEYRTSDSGLINYLLDHAADFAALLDAAETAVDDGYDRGAMIAALKPFAKD